MKQVINEGTLRSNHALNFLYFYEEKFLYILKNSLKIF